MNITILGAGAWGTALACAVARRHRVLLWARGASSAADLHRQRENLRYLPGVMLPQELQITADRTQALQHAQDGLTVIATPMSGLREQLEHLHTQGDGRAVLWLCKGFEAGTASLGHELSRQLRPDAPCGILSGPSFAAEVAAGQPTALVAASADDQLLDKAVRAFHSEALRVYTSTDLVGVEVGGAMKNVLAIATGMVDGLTTAGLNTRAALITRGLAEMTRLGVAMGARPDTFMGLSGLGDLVLTATGDLSRNRRVGLLLAKGQTLAQALASLGHVAEGVPTAAMALQRALALGVELPITAAVVEVLEGRLTPADAMQQLMSRQSRAEVQGW